MRRKDQVRASFAAAAMSLAIILIAWPLACSAQSAPGGPSASSADLSLTEVVHELQAQVRELRQSIDELRAETARYRAETQAMHGELQPSQAASRMQPETSAPAVPAGAGLASAGIESAAPVQPPNAGGELRLAKVEEDVQLLNEKVNQQDQTKVESGSKYRLRLYGIALANLFDNRGSVDSIDNPATAQPAASDSSGSLGATVRQSIIGLQAFGPQVAGAKTTADVQFDFAAGFPSAQNGDIYGIARLRTATLRLDWTQTSVVAGQDSLFFAPLSPTSFASLSTPALAYSGNLWAWTPQIRVEHRVELPDGSGLTLQAGLLDPLTGEYPGDPYYRLPTAGEAADQPAYAARAAYTHDVFGLPLTIGFGGYFARQDWGLPHRVNAWAGTSDLSVPLGQLFTLSGEFYRGSAVGGLGGGIGQSVLFTGPEYNPTSVEGLNSIGGWAQLKFMPRPKLEFNGAFGLDNPFADQFNLAEVPAGYYLIERNRGSLVNVIFRPRSDLVLALEYRHLRTYEFPAETQSANQVNLGVGVLF